MHTEARRSPARTAGFSCVFLMALMYNVSCSLIPGGMWECTCEDEREPCEEGSDLPPSLCHSLSTSFCLSYLRLLDKLGAVFACLTPPSSIWRSFLVHGKCCCAFVASPWGKAAYTSHEHAFYNFTVTLGLGLVNPSIFRFPSTGAFELYSEVCCCSLLKAALKWVNIVSAHMQRA